MGWEKATPGRGTGTYSAEGLSACLKQGRERVPSHVREGGLGGGRRVPARGLTPNQEAALLSRRGAGEAARRRLGMAGEL